MMDQAEKLRQIIDDLKFRNAVTLDNPSGVREKTAKVITVTSGKGGVGKTNITINLAIALSELGKRVTILDADFGLANIDILLGIVPKYTLVDVLYDKKNILEVLTDGPKNIKFMSGGSGVEELVKLDSTQLEKFVSNISLLDKLSDVILIDTGAGLSESVMSFVMAADEVFLVTTPEPTSITDAYALIKMISNRENNKIIRVVVNRAENANEAKDILNRLSMVTEKFLAMKLYPLGFIPQDESVIKAVKMQQPFSLSFPKCDATKHIKEISKRLIEGSTGLSNRQEGGIKGFVRRLVNLMNA
ncbi:MAG TPA: MinD/ParA family protein [Hungateiclostridium thermocellum]|uniref:Cobyrinic acid ac-diamide synthase n=1 Tax=Acetivibrio thermocellus (strain ATCC 27405 / DSM 1237 / JCM 9322 / NBRC 103400 / NCIMB 10682 / NRRL B-4536 / VPI 7372) TaxID=203119 RepID=A3DCP6_ACET2|nr:MinD/ParA family protein [Acetivibrio thermocellus]CDG35201.1 cobyrinic acid a,c-diamide synthase [Acetivibrio thermocellus BC1]ABN51725.1 cobyrinic acid ac-diamide synthase [Acetivibrio thermocellus ATCC 27405]THJ77755.1 MinD/ParA family protein [Acetivibrio thermocellus]UWV45748.1 MinD/ParA family protein [Acetivibrio thermocellus]HBW26993.1 MinD/ParA family protein [Acetivibrio thermocellus]